ncbi:hypothetical protein B0H12DRAFT_1243079 [Mycena haematopus]|nr:hypothetical protein B0H12DRAFT_1243079 [Mycena haematopus]
MDDPPWPLGMSRPEQTPDTSVVHVPPPADETQPSPNDALESLRPDGPPRPDEAPRVESGPRPTAAAGRFQLDGRRAARAGDRRQGETQASQKGMPKARPGKLPWVHGTKKNFFRVKEGGMASRGDAHRSGAFYTKVAKLYVKKYGYDLADDQDLAVDVEDPPDSAADEVVHEMLSPEELAPRAAYHKNAAYSNWPVVPGRVWEPTEER